MCVRVCVCVCVCDRKKYHTEKNIKLHIVADVKFQVKGTYHAEPVLETGTKKEERGGVQE